MTLPIGAGGAAGCVAHPVIADTPATVPLAPSSFTNSRLSMLIGLSSGVDRARSALLLREEIGHRLELRVGVAACVLVHDRRRLRGAGLEVEQRLVQIALRLAGERRHLARAAALEAVAGRAA